MYLFVVIFIYIYFFGGGGGRSLCLGISVLLVIFILLSQILENFVFDRELQNISFSIYGCEMLQFK